MKKLLKITGIILAIVFIAIAIFYYTKNEKLPEGKQGTEADALANKMLKALNYEAYKSVEILEWSFREKHFYSWNKQENTVKVIWDGNTVLLNTVNPKESKYLSGDNSSNEKNLIQNATDFFNNDSFWLVAPYKVFDNGVERRLVNYNDKEALLVTYTSGGSTPGDSYLWILDENGMPTDYKMWTSLIPVGGVAATWNEWKTTDAGIKLPKTHTLSLFGMVLDMGTVKASNPKADQLANNILKAIKHDAYKKTRYLEWSFGGKRFFKWDKKAHIVEVSWNKIKVILHPNNIEKSTVFIDKKEVTKEKEKSVKRALRFFNNDSFWLVAPHKLFENGIIRSIQKHQGKDALLVKYTTGGSTPGDSYLWILDDNYLPISYKMYVPSMKMEGVEATWEDWITTESGTLLPKNHTFGKDRTLSMGDVKAYN